MIYHRYCSDAISPFTGERYGIFVAVWHLIRDRKVTEDEEAEYWQHRTWFEENLPLPPFYSEGNPRRAVTWFKDCAMSHPTLARLSFYRDLAARYQLEIGLESTGEPGEIIYEDDFQVAAIRKEIAELRDTSNRGHRSSLNSGFDSRGSRFRNSPNESMSKILRNLGFAWHHFVRGKHRPASHPLENFLAKLDWHESPLVGNYVRTDQGNWWADARLPALDQSVRLLASGPEPTSEQMDAFSKVVAGLPGLIEKSTLEALPENDGWGNSPPPFDISTAPISSIWMRADGGFFLILEVDPEGIYMLSPAFEISPDFQLLSSEWCV